MTAAEAAGDVAPLYNAEDLQFLHHMSAHHSQALDLCALLAGRTEREEFLRFARYVARAQGAEIGMMEGMLETAAARGLMAHAHDMSGDPPMAGMLPSAEMAALEAATGAEFERLWLEGMIFHHDGGLAMARAQQLQQLHYGRRPYGLESLVESIIVEQRAEIAKMRGWLDAWDLIEGGQGPDRRAPASEISSPTPGTVATVGAELAVFGLSVDDTDVASVEIGIQNLDTGQWLRADGSWGAQQSLAVATARSGPGSAAWRYDWTPPAAGRYAVTAAAEDATGRRAAARETRELRAE
jgi:uncharacterized protein (DUF305 family)